MEEVHDIEWAMLRLQEIIDTAENSEIAKKGYGIWKVLRQAHMDMQANAMCNVTCRHFRIGLMDGAKCRACMGTDGGSPEWEWRGAAD